MTAPGAPPGGDPDPRPDPATGATGDPSAGPPPGPSLAEVADLLVVPDHAGSLHRDAVALRRERRWGRRGPSGPLLVLVLLVVAGAGALMTALAPSSPGRVAPAPLATAPAAPPGSVDGLLPDGALRVGTGGGEVVRLRSARLRPGVLALVGAGCDCDPAVRAAVEGSLSYGLTLRVVTAASADPDGAEARRLAAGPARGLVPLGVDLEDRLHLAYAPRGLTLVLVRPDGTVDAVLRGVDERDRLEPALQRLVGRTPPT